MDPNKGLFVEKEWHYRVVLVILVLLVTTRTISTNQMLYEIAKNIRMKEFKVKFYISIFKEIRRDLYR